MKKIWLLVAALVALAFLMACNKQTPPRLDYSKKMKDGLYSPNGLPGAAKIGGTAEEDKFHGYHATQDDDAKPDEKKPDEKKPDEKNK